MKSLASLLFSVALLLPMAQASEAAEIGVIPLSQDMVTIPSDTVVVPEPSSTVFAGIGGLALLFFMLRRRNAGAR